MTREELRRYLHMLNLAGENVIVHARLDKLGFQEANAGALVGELIIEAVGTGTVLIPAFTPHTIVPPIHYDRREDSLPPVPFSLDLPVDEPVAEALRHFSGVLRSPHPTHSFLAVGPLSRELLSTHRDNNPLGPIKKLNLYRGSVVLLGSNLTDVVALQLALEPRISPSVRRRTALRINAGAHVERVVIDNFPGCSRGFDKLEALLSLEKIQCVPLSHASLRKIPLRYLLQLAHSVLEHDPFALLCDDSSCTDCRSARIHLSQAYPH
ncbi:MAG: AAC(3) family N-acetyltransferase [Candidatus Binatia bacterium]|nr:AAC(3) family N-acetyltransferase [Candidatus Binatia bacterium]